MSWINALVPFAAGFFKGFLEEYARPGAAAGAPSSRNHDFHAHMRQLAAATGLPIDQGSDETAAFRISAHGSGYTFVLLDKGTQIIIRGHSDYSFPAGGVPRAVSRCMELRNAREERFSYGVTNVDDRALLCVTTMAATHTLTPATFQAVITTLCNAIVALERTLVRYGFAG